MNKQEKYNPDVNKKYEQVSKDRDHQHYTYNKEVYKGITNDFPNKIESPDDLKLKIDTPDYDAIKIKMEDAIKDREQDKLNQEKLLKELAEKKISKKLIINTGNSSNVSESFQDMKDSYQKFTVNKNDILSKEKIALNDVLDFINKL